MDDIRNIFIAFALLCLGAIAYNNLELDARGVKGNLLGAAETGDTSEVREFLDRGIDINDSSSRGTALHRAAYYGHIEVVKLLVEKGADINSQIQNSFASFLSKATVRDFGIDDGIDQAFGATPLHLGVYNNHMRTVEYLLEKGADPTLKLTLGSDWKSQYIRTTLQIAEEKGHKEIISLLSRPSSGLAREKKS